MTKVQLKSNNRLTIPQKIATELNVTAGDDFLLEVQDGRLILIPAESVPRDEAYLFTPFWIEALKEAHEDIAEGRVKSAPTVAEMIRQIRGK